jgi:hypothetical protein
MTHDGLAIVHPAPNSSLNCDGSGEMVEAAHGDEAITEVEPEMTAAAVVEAEAPQQQTADVKGEADSMNNSKERVTIDAHALEMAAARGLSQKEIAGELGCSHKTLVNKLTAKPDLRQAYESGRTRFKSDSPRRLGSKSARKATQKRTRRASIAPEANGAITPTSVPPPYTRAQARTLTHRWSTRYGPRSSS